MVTVTGELQKAAWRARALPPVERVRPGLWSIPVPIPNNPLRYVLCYAIESDVGVTLVDTGWPGDEPWDALISGLEQIGANVGDLTGVLLTHAHPDHHGLASRLRDVSGCWIAMHSLEADHLSNLRDIDDVLQANEAWIVLCGIPSDEADSMVVTAADVRGSGDVIPDRLLTDGGDAGVPGRRVRPVWTPGHTPGHLCYAMADEEAILTGDHTLPRITSNVSSYRAYDAPLGQYLSSLARVEEFDELEALPGHEYRFRGIAERSAFIQRHHRRRLSEIEKTLRLAGPQTAWEVSRGLHWSRTWAETTGYLRRAALAETLAHLRLLEDRSIASPGTAPDYRWRINVDGGMFHPVNEHSRHDGTVT